MSTPATPSEPARTAWVPDGEALRGRVAVDPGRARWNQHSVTSGRLAAGYGFTDVDGSQPDIWPRLERPPEGSEPGSDPEPPGSR